MGIKALYDCTGRSCVSLSRFGGGDPRDYADKMWLSMLMVFM